MNRFLQLTLLTLTVLFFSACSQKIPQSNKIISNPSILKPVPNKENEFYYISNSFDVNNYNRVRVSDISIIIDEDDKNDIDAKILSQTTTYLQKNLQKELTDILKNNKSNNELIMEISINSFDVSYDMIMPWELMPIGLGIKAIMLTTGLEKRKLHTVLALKLHNKYKQDELLYVDYETRKDMPSYDELTFNNIKPLLDHWVKNYAKGLQELKDYKHTK